MDAGVRAPETQTNVEIRFLRSRIINLTLDWELEALSLDAQRYRTSGAEKREQLRDCALAYRKCIAKLTELLDSNALLASKRY